MLSTVKLKFKYRLIQLHGFISYNFVISDAKSKIILICGAGPFSKVVLIATVNIVPLLDSMS